MKPLSFSHLFDRRLDADMTFMAFCEAKNMESVFFSEWMQRETIKKYDHFSLSLVNSNSLSVPRIKGMQKAFYKEMSFWLANEYSKQIEREFAQFFDFIIENWTSQQKVFAMSGPEEKTIRDDDKYDPLSFMNEDLDDPKVVEQINNAMEATITKRPKHKKYKQDLPPPTKRTEIDKILFSPHVYVDSNGREKRYEWWETFKNASVDDSRQILDIIADGRDKGKNPRVIARELQKKMGIPRARAETIARTESMRYHAEVQWQQFEALGKALNGIRYTATLDTRTRPRHAALDGTIYYRELLKGRDAMDNAPRLPNGCNCRCTYVPIVVSRSKAAKEFTRSYRSITNKSEEADYTKFTAWFNNLPAPQQIKILGSKKRYDEVKAAGKNGKVLWENAFSETGRPLTSKEIQKKKQKAARF